MKHRLQRLALTLAGRRPGRGERWPRKGRFPCPPGEPSGSRQAAPSAGGAGTARGASFDFDLLAKELAQGLSRREALRRLSRGVGAAALASLGLAAPALAAPPGCPKGELDPKRIARRVVL